MPPQSTTGYISTDPNAGKPTAPPPASPASGGYLSTDPTAGISTSPVPPPIDWSNPQATPFTAPPTSKTPLQLPPGPPDSWAHYAIEGGKLAAMFLGARTGLGMVGEAAPLALRLGAQVAGAGAGSATAGLVGRTLVDPNGPPSVPALAGDVGEDFLQGATGEAAGQAMGAGFRAVKTVGGRAMGKAFDWAAPPSVAGREAAAVLGEENVSPGMKRDSPVLRAAEKFTRGAAWTQPLRDLFGRTATALSDRTNAIMDSFGPRKTSEEAGQAVRDRLLTPLQHEAQHTATLSHAYGDAADRTRQELYLSAGPVRSPAETGSLLQQLTDSAHDAAKTAGSKLYDEVDRVAEAMGQPKVSTQSMLDFASAEAERRGQLATSITGGKTKSMLNAVEATGTAAEPPMVLPALGGIQPNNPRYAQLARRVFGDALGEAGATDATQLTFRQAHETRAALGRVIRTAENSSAEDANTVRGIAAQLRTRLDTAMTDAAGGADSPLRRAYDTATQAWKGMSQTFEHGVLADLAEKEPHQVVDYLLTPGRSAKDFQTTWEALGPAARKAVQASALEKVLKGSTGEWLTGPALAKKLVALNKGTSGTVTEAIFGQPGAAKLSRMVDALTTQAKTAGRVADLQTAARAVPDATEAISSIVQPGNVKAIRTARQLVGEQDWKGVQSAVSQKLLAGTGKNAIPTGEELAKRLKLLTPETLAEVFPADQAAALHQLARVLTQVGDTASVTSPWTVRLQAGAGVGIAASGHLLTGGTVLVGPLILSRILANSQARSTLMAGLKAGTTPTGVRLGNQLLAWIAREGLGPRQGAPPTVGGPAATQPVTAPAGRGPGPAGGLAGPPPKGP